MSDPIVNIDAFRKLREDGAKGASELPANPPPLREGGGGGTFDGMETRVTRLEEQMSGVRDDLRDIKASLALLPTLASKADISAWKIQWTAIFVAAFAVIVGSIIGGLGWLETRATRLQPVESSAAQRSQPIVITLPTPQAQSTPETRHP